MLKFSGSGRFLVILDQNQPKHSLKPYQMKKLFLLFAFTGIVGAASATTLTATKAEVVTVKGDDKKGDDKKKKDAKACCKSHEAKACSGEKTEAKACSGAGEKKSCCKAKAEGSTASTTTTTTTTKSEK